MPTYAFACPNCATEFDEKRSFAHADDPATCPICGDSHTTKVISTIAFYSPGSAAKALLDPGARKTASAPAPSTHASGCPCCSPRRLPSKPV
ncbi:MAG TPA: zinc ribbon domain-containing protein [Thermomicrobiales bacterium]|nr:zinc ribbon domain-containing protein [Thermomicrobiales bacterium]